MATPQQRAQCVSWYIDTKSTRQTQVKFQRRYREEPPEELEIGGWYQTFLETGTLVEAPDREQEIQVQIIHM